jgi:protein TonB
VLKPALTGTPLTSPEGLHTAKDKIANSKPSKAKSLPLLSDDLSLTEGREKTIGKSPAPPTFGMIKKRKTSPLLLAVVALALVAAGVYAYSTMNPGFHSLLISQYQNVRSLTGLAPKPQPVAALPKPAPLPAALPAPSPAQPVGGTPTSADASENSNQVPDGFAAPQGAPSQGFKSSAAPQKSATPVILSTSATVQKAASDDELVVVPEDVADGHVAYRVQPVYPEAARHKGVKGAVVLMTDIGKDGNVASVQVVKGNPQLASAAIAAVKQWRYEAYYRNGQPIDFQTQVTVRFPPPARP